MYERIIIPLDGSDLAEEAVATAEGLTRSLNVPLHLVRVIDYPSSTFSYVYGGMIESEAIAMQLEHERGMAETYLKEIARSLEQRGLKVTTEVRHGVPVQEICDAMKQGDLVVIASHGRSGVARWFLGSVAEEITRRSSVPVLLVRAASRTSNHRSSESAALTA